MEAELTPVEGVVDALDRIRTPTCVASSSTHERLRFTLGLTGLLERFDGRIFSSTDVAHGKPAPDLFLHAAGSWGVTPADGLVIEDSPLGVAAAVAAGMKVFGYAGMTDPAKLSDADTVFHNMAALADLIDGA
jgi:HAD superfamily hydrolase (TIGR01509 family)